LIQDQTKTSNIDSPQRPIGFDYCAIAMRQRVLQHIRGQSGRDRLRESAFAVVIRGAADMASCSAYVGLRPEADIKQSPLDGMTDPPSIVLF
jgi:hypothetical protein